MLCSTGNLTDYDVERASFWNEDSVFVFLLALLCILKAELAKLVVTPAEHLCVVHFLRL